MVVNDKRLAQKAAAQARYRKTEKGRRTNQKYFESQKGLEAKKRWRKKHNLKVVVHRIVRDAKKAGELSEQPCEVCGIKDNIHAHHDDYSKPLDVRWLCAVHHAQHHKIGR